VIAASAGATIGDTGSVDVPGEAEHDAPDVDDEES
jgi:hypothetical protein